MNEFTKGLLTGIVLVSLISLYFFLEKSMHEFQDRDYTCRFMRMESVFEATEYEVNSDSPMITVYIGDRTFMFRRDNLAACFKLKPEDYDEETPSSS